MSMTDPIADLLTRIRNAQTAGHAQLRVPRSKLKLELVKILKQEGFLEGYVEEDGGPQGWVKIFLRYDGARTGVIRGIRRVSRPSRHPACPKRPRCRHPHHPPGCVDGSRCSNGWCWRRGHVPRLVR